MLTSFGFAGLFVFHIVSETNPFFSGRTGSLLGFLFRVCLSFHTFPNKANYLIKKNSCSVFKVAKTALMWKRSKIQIGKELQDSSDLGFVAVS